MTDTRAYAVITLIQHVYNIHVHVASKLTDPLLRSH